MAPNFDALPSGDTKTEIDGVSIVPQCAPLLNIWQKVVPSAVLAYLCVVGAVIMYEHWSSTNTVFYRNMTISLSMPILGGLLQLAHEHLDDNKHNAEGQFSSGPMIPISAVWYLYSNYVCANAAMLYCTFTPWTLRVIGWSGLMGGGIDHIMETYQWYVGRHKVFGVHWLQLGSKWMIFPLYFAIGSIIGIIAVIFEIAYREETTPVFWVCIIAIMVPTLVYELHFSHPMVGWVGGSSCNFHLNHMFITHIGLSMMPAMMVWGFHPEINLFSMPFLQAK